VFQRFFARVFVTFVLVTGLAGGVGAQDLKLRLAHVAPPQTTYQDAAVRFAENVKALSGGKITIEIIPGGALGDLGQLWVQTRTGALDLHLIDLSAIVAMREGRPFSVMWAPYLFKDQAHLHRFIEGAAFKSMMANVEKETSVVYLGDVGDRPPRALSTGSKVVTTPADLAGLKIRTPEHPVIVGTFKAWGAVPTPIKASELFVALKSGLVDGQDNGSIDFLGAGYGEVQKAYMPLDYIYSAMGVWMAGQRWQTLSEEQRGWLRAAAAKARDDGRKQHSAAMKAAADKMAAAGITIGKPDMAAFQKASESVIKEFDGKMWPAGLYQQIRDLP
jgi:TRAP-type C4-dicarboxylate transport system substrate-binding protein